MSAAPLKIGWNDRLEGILDRVNELAVLPHVVYKVLELSGSEDTSAVEIERTIQVDPGFSSRVLTLANSAYFGLPKKVSAIKDAIMFCGLKAVRELAMTVGVYDMFMGKQDRQSLRRRGWWRHSLDTAICGKWLAAKTRVLAPEEAYTGGLLHLIGKSLLDRFADCSYDEAEVLIAGGMRDYEAEQQVFGTNHVAVALAASEKWGFPPALTEGLNYINQPTPEDLFQAHRACTAVSSPIALFAINGKLSGQTGSLSLPLWATKVLGVPDECHLELISGAITAIGSAASIHG